MGRTAFLVLLSVLFAVTTEGKPNQYLSKFPEDFEFGSATAAYQAEGAWNVDGKGLSIWDHLVRTKPEQIFDNTTGDVAANSYFLHKRDTEMLKELGVKNYRMSISWPRILPNGDASQVNPLGIAHYNAVIDELLANGITPFVTIYHWDLPQHLSEKGGWLNDDIVEWFSDYARILYENFGDRVKNWLTVNEPWVHCYLGYGSALHAPQVKSPGVGYYECGRNMLLAHAKAYRIYDEEFRPSQGGEVGIVLSLDWPIAETDSEDDQNAVKDYIAFGLGHFMDPIFTKTGNYPQRVIERVEKASIQQGFNASRLRPLTEWEIDYIKGTADFLGLNHYSSKIVYRNESVVGQNEVPSVLDDAFYGQYIDPSWPFTGGYIYEYAPGFYSLIKYVQETYNNPKVYITENGCSVTENGLVDPIKVQYYRNYLSALLQAIEEGANVKGYFAWSLMDSFEWNFGYTIKFGLYETDMNDPDRKRTARKSALVYKEIVRSKVIDYEYDVDPYSHVLIAGTTEGKPKQRLSKFPEDFEFGSATAAYQAEGAWNVDGKGLSIWDHLVRTKPEQIFDNTTGDVAANSYFLHKRDTEMLKELGVKNYRMSISWPRILPNGDASQVNPLGIAHYNAVIDELLANGITPFVTIYHWDLPQHLSEKGGWLNDEIVDWFSDYARILYENFGDRVKNWLTVNEPWVHCYLGYGSALHAPQVKSPGVGYYECGRNMLLAHAKAYRIYDEEFRPSQGGEVGIVLSLDWPIAESDSEDDKDAVEDYIAFGLGHFMDPIFTKTGNYPQRVIERVEKASIQQGFNASRLRPLTEWEIDYIKGTADFLGLNHYSSKIVYRNESVVGQNEVPSVLDDAFYGQYIDPSWPFTGGYIYEYAPGFYSLIKYVQETYNNPKVYITENGCSVTETGLVDPIKVQYYRNYLSALLQAIEEGANVKGYFAWSLMDSFEWNFGYTIKFGLYETDMNDPDRKRTARKSALVYKEIVRSKVIDYEYDIDPYSQ